MEPDYFQYLSDRPMGDGLFYCYRWLLVTFKRGEFVLKPHPHFVANCSSPPPPPPWPVEFDYGDVFRLWETVWASRLSVSNHFEEFFALAIMKQFK